MTRLLLAFTVWSYVITPIALSAGGPENRTSAQPAPANLAPVYVKIIWPDDPATPANEKDRPVIESWITKSIENRSKAKFRAVTGWVPVPLDGTELWDGKLDGTTWTCIVYADVFERKDGLIKIRIDGWSPASTGLIAQIIDEPGSREVVPVLEVKNKHGMPHVAIFIGLPVKSKALEAGAL